MEVISRHWSRTPVPIEKIISEMGVDYEQEFLDENVSGFIERKPDGDYRIVVNAWHPESRRRFTAAHELAHYIYHRDLLGSGVGDNRAYRAEGTQRPNPNIRPLHERQANSFAANVLMPKHALLNVQDKSTAELAVRFGVSPEAMRIRLGR
jgi:Zn-dependent peptidase ImmA (M78 family)